MAEVLGRFEDIVALAPEHGPTLEAIRALVREVHPEAVETARPGDRAVTWGWGPAKMREGYAYAMPQKTYVNLGFYQGTSLPDPGGRLEGTGKGLRHVKLRGPLEVAELWLRDLLLAARDVRRATLKR